jgi:hypothetical protein
MEKEPCPKYHVMTKTRPKAAAQSLIERLNAHPPSRGRRRTPRANQRQTIKVERATASLAPILASYPVVMTGTPLFLISEKSRTPHVRRSEGANAVLSIAHRLRHYIGGEDGGAALGAHIVAHHLTFVRPTVSSRLVPPIRPARPSRPIRDSRHAGAVPYRKVSVTRMRSPDELGRRGIGGDGQTGGSRRVHRLASHRIHSPMDVDLVVADVDMPGRSNGFDLTAFVIREKAMGEGGHYVRPRPATRWR